MGGYGYCLRSMFVKQVIDRMPIFKLFLWLCYLILVLVADVSEVKISKTMLKSNANLGQMLTFHCIAVHWHALG